MTRFVESGTKGRIRKTQALGRKRSANRVFGIFRVQKYILVSAYKQDSRNGD